jgi:hypothetical protein
VSHLDRTPSVRPATPASHALLQRLYEFDAARYGISDELAAAIATVFSAFDSDANGVLSLDEFTRLWWVGLGVRLSEAVCGGCAWQLLCLRCVGCWSGLCDWRSCQSRSCWHAHASHGLPALPACAAAICSPLPPPPAAPSTLRS